MRERYITLDDLTYIDEGDRYRVCGYIYKSKMSPDERIKIATMFDRQNNYISHGVLDEIKGVKK